MLKYYKQFTGTRFNKKKEKKKIMKKNMRIFFSQKSSPATSFGFSATFYINRGSSVAVE